MWLKTAVVGIKPGPKAKGIEVFLHYSANQCPFTITDQSLAAFCFPLGADSQTPKDRMAPEEYTFTLTQGDGTRVQGFCRRFLPPPPRVGSKLRYPQVLVLLTEASWSSFFYKVLEVAEQLLRQTDLLLDSSNAELPAKSYAGIFFGNLAAQLATPVPLGCILRVELPQAPTPLSISPPKRIGAGSGAAPLACTEEYVELQVPPDDGNGAHNAGVSLARLLWHVPVPAMVTLIASLLLERRVVVVGQSRDMVSAAVCAAAALIYPFKWHHIYLPLLPVSFKDYLTAPMPFLVGLPAQLLPQLKQVPMDEVTTIDLDLQRCEPAPGSPADDAHQLPWRENLEAALHAAFSMLRSPTEHEGNPLIAGIMQGYFLKLLGNYRSHIYAEGCGPAVVPGGGLGGGPAGSSPHPLPSPRSGRSTPGPRDDAISGNGYWFDQAGLVAYHRRNERAQQFLAHFRQSQMYEVFIQQRLTAAAAQQGFEHLDLPFELRVSAYLDHRSQRLAARLSAGVRSSLSRFQAFVKKHRRTESLGDAELARLKQLASAFAAGIGERMRQTGEELFGVNGSLGNGLPTLPAATSSSGSAQPWQQQQLQQQQRRPPAASVDPSMFFEDDEDDLEEAEAAMAAAGGGMRRMARTESANSMSDMAAGNSSSRDSLASAAVPVSRGASQTTGGGTGMRRDASWSNLFGGITRSPEQQQQAAAGGGPMQRGLAAQSVPVAAAYGGSSSSSRPPPAAPLINLDDRWSPERPPRPSSSSALGGPSLGHGAHATSAAAGGGRAGPSSSGGSFSSSSGLSRPSVMHMRNALAAIQPGPLPQPPQPRNALHSSSGGAAPLLPPPAAVIAPKSPGPAVAGGTAGGLSAALAQQQQVPNSSPGLFTRPVINPEAAAAGVRAQMLTGIRPAAAPPPTPAAAQPAVAPAAADAGWDPFAELVAERQASATEASSSGPQGRAAASSSSGGGAASSRDSSVSGSLASSEQRTPVAAVVLQGPGMPTTIKQQQQQLQGYGSLIPDLLDAPLEPMPSVGSWQQQQPVPAPAAAQSSSGTEGNLLWMDEGPPAAPAAVQSLSGQMQQASLLD